MPYNRNTWVDNVTQTLAADMNNIEAGLVEASNTISPTISPLTYGAVGDNTADDKTALIAAIAAGGTSGIPVDLRGHTYKTTDTIPVPAGVTLCNGTIRCTGAARVILNVTGDNVTIRAVTVIGANATTTAADLEHGIYASGASAAAPLNNIRIESCSISLVGMYGIQLRFVHGFRVTGNDLTNIGYTGIGTLSASDGRIEANRITNVLAAALFSFDGYGIALSRANETIDSLITSPRSSDIVVRGNRVQGVPWEGIDTHAGQHITIDANIVLGCRTGIAVVGGTGANGPTYGARQITVTGNAVDSQVTDGSAQPGITFTGAQGLTSAAPAVEYSTGTIVGNTIRGHGDQSDNTEGALYLRNTKGVTVQGNQIEEPSVFGIMLYYDNRAVAVIGNTITDAWSNTSPVAGAVSARADNNVGTLIGNSLARGAKAATNVNQRGLYNSGIGTALVGGATVNDFAAAVTPF